MSDLNKKNINYGALNRFYQDLKNNDLSKLQGKLTAGNNITISGNTISAAGGVEYTAGNNIQINGNVISATDTIYTLPTASSNIKGGVKVGDGLDIDIYSILSLDKIYLSETINDVIRQISYDTLPIKYQYLTFEAMEDECDITFTLTKGSSSTHSGNLTRTISVSKDLINWNDITSVVNSSIVISTLNKGEKVYIKGNNLYYAEFGGNWRYSYYHHFNTSKNCYIYGNVMSLFKGNGFENITSIQHEYGLMGLFIDNNKLYSHNIYKLVLPVTTLSKGCYFGMFQHCTNLTTAPELPAQILRESCYQTMFSGCTNLNYVTCLATDKSARWCTNDWLNGVSSGGTFLKDSGVTWDTGSSAIPSGWIVEDYNNAEPVIYEPIVIDETTFTGSTLTVDGSQPSIVASGSTTIVWDDLAASIPSGKSVEVSVVLINTGNSALTPTMQGNYQMMGDGNLTIQAGELGLYRGRYISALNKWLIEAIYQEVSGTAE